MEEIIVMYFVPDQTELCGFYECNECGNRFLDERIVPKMVCPYCGEVPEVKEDAVLLKVVEGKDAVEQYDKLLSLAMTGGDYNWI